MRRAPLPVGPGRLAQSRLTSAPSLALNEQLQQPAKLAPVTSGQGLEQSGLGAIDGLVQTLERGLGVRGVRDQVAAAVLLVADARDEAFALELVEDCVQVAAVDPQPAPQLRL